MNYSKLIKNLDSSIKNVLLKNKLTLAEKILYAHTDNPLESIPTRGSTYLKLRPGKRFQSAITHQKIFFTSRPSRYARCKCSNRFTTIHAG